MQDLYMPIIAKTPLKNLWTRATKRSICESQQTQLLYSSRHPQIVPTFLWRLRVKHLLFAAMLLKRCMFFVALDLYKCELLLTVSFAFLVKAEKASATQTFRWWRKPFPDVPAPYIPSMRFCRSLQTEWSYGHCCLCIVVQKVNPFVCIHNKFSWLCHAVGLYNHTPLYVVFIRMVKTLFMFRIHFIETQMKEHC